MNYLVIYGAAELIKRQDGYSYNPLKKQPIPGWPAHMVVIADDSADPYVLDLSQSNGEDAPVMFAYHGQGKWDFQPYAASFSEFLRKIHEK